MLCFTKGANDECNVVEAVTWNYDYQITYSPCGQPQVVCQPKLQYAMMFLRMRRKLSCAPPFLLKNSGDKPYPSLFS